MKIDRDVEPLVREAFAASVAAHPDRFENAVRAIAKSDVIAARSFALAFTVDALALLSIHHDQRPSDAELSTLAASFSDAETWADIDEPTAAAFLTSLADGAPPTDPLASARAAPTAFAVGGWLLSAFLPEDGSQWSEFLDSVLAKVESAPER